MSMDACETSMLMLLEKKKKKKYVNACETKEKEIC